MKRQVSIILILISSHTIIAQNEIVGFWKTIDDNTGKARSVVEIYQIKNAYYGKIRKLYRDPGEDPNPMCEECEEDDDRYMKPIIGMEIIRGLKEDENEYSGGTILDPENGSAYRCKIWLEDGNLKLRGYVAFFFRTQTWLAYEGEF